MTENTKTTGTNANNTTATNGSRDAYGCIVLKIDIFKTKFADAAAESIDKMVAEKAAVVETGEETSLADAACELTSIKPENTPFDDAVAFMKSISGEDFIELVSYAKAHHNKFLNCVKELRGGVNADDVYCSALIELARPLGEQVERRVFNLLSEAVDEGSIDKFVEFFEALKVING